MAEIFLHFIFHANYEAKNLAHIYLKKNTHFIIIH